MPSISVRRLFDDNQYKLQLAWAAGNSGADNRIGVEADKPVLALVGHLNFIHPNQIQVVGLAESEYLNRLESGETGYQFGDLFDISMSLVIVANGLPVSPGLRDYCHKNDIPLLTSKLESPYLMDVLRIYLQRTLAASSVKHGVFLDVFEIGVLITGHSGLGKSELALELISRGHSLIADDAVELFRIGPETLEGRCSPMLRDFLEVRGLGILNIRHIFGETSIRPKKILQLIINLVEADDEYMKQLDRLSIRTETESILNVNVRSVTLPVAVGRNLAVLVEAAVRNYILQLRGKDSTREFLERHQTQLKEDVRSGIDIGQAREQIAYLRGLGHRVEVLFVEAEESVLVRRFSETRRGHPLSNQDMTLLESLKKEREWLFPLKEIAYCIDTSKMNAQQLRHAVRQWLKVERTGLLVILESFGFKYGVPNNADFMFDMRSLPNPYYDPELRPYTGMDKPVWDYLDGQPLVQEMVDDIEKFLTHWLPRLEDESRSYVTVAIGCTGGQHRSVYVVEKLARRLKGRYELLIRHRQAQNLPSR